MTAKARRALKLVCVLIAATGFLLLQACSNGPGSTFDELGADGNTRGFGRKYSQDPEENEFVFGVGDEVLIEVPDEPKLSGRFAIRNDGNFSFAWMGDILGAGLTPSQLKKKVTGRLALYLKDPEVVLGVGEVQSKRYYIAAPDIRLGGSIIKSMEFRGDVVLFDVFVQMGAPSSLLDDDKHVKIIRGDPRQPRVLTVNVTEIYKKGLTGGNIQIRPDDIIYVPPTWIGHVNSAIAGISAPFQSLFTISRAVVSVNYSVRILSGDATFAMGGAF
ncbi:MAG: hypothetical protein EXS14_07970 [Planctomycetes bacterium]|nr:hypothetical protein [Planctomycetota bacterium]